MARSMTAYGKAHFQTKNALFLIEIHSVNRKGLEIQTYLLKEFLTLDLEIRNRLKTVVERGTITVRITKETGNAYYTEMPPIDSIKDVHAQLKQYAKELGYSSHQDVVPFSSIVPFFFSGLPSYITIPLNEDVKMQVFKAFDQALDAFVQIKETEGAALIQDLLLHLDKVREGVEKVKMSAKIAPQAFEERLETKLKRLNCFQQIDSERLLREVILFADKIDTAEEIIRLISHIQQFQGFIEGGQLQIGRELGFLTQEMHREVTTIGSKSQDLKTIQAVLEIKLELEKIREQVANIE